MAGRSKNPATYQVVVSNCGLVHECEEPSEARYFFECYREYSRANYGRAAGESVTLLAYGEPIQEFVGYFETLDADEEEQDHASN